jgi:hypothetical protein
MSRLLMCIVACAFASLPVPASAREPKKAEPQPTDERLNPARGD